MSTLNVSLLTTTQPDQAGFTLSCVNSYSTPSGYVSVASFSYCVFPSFNVSSNDAVNSIYNKTSNVGTQHCSNISSNYTQYTLFIDTSMCLPDYDYYCSVSALYSDGTQSEYTQALMLPLSASKIPLIEDQSASMTRSAGTYNTEATITVIFDPVVVPMGSTISYTLAIQYIDGEEGMNFSIVPNLAYNDLIGGISYTIANSKGVDEAYVAVQSTRAITGTTITATSELSNTVAAVDTQVPDPPRNLTLDYLYYAAPKPLVDLAFSAPFSAELTDITHFILYRQIENNTAEQLAQIPYVSGTMSYTYTDDTIGEIPLGTEVSYYAKSVNPVESSAPSNIVTLMTVQSSSAPRNLGVNGIQVSFATPFAQDIRFAFVKPDNVQGLPVYNYDTANFLVNIIDKNNNSPTFNQIIGTKYIPYSIDNISYAGGFEDLPFYSDSFNILPGIYECRVSLNTYTYDGGVLLGQTAIQQFSSGPRPLILDCNGVEDLWTKESPLTTFLVVSGGATLLNDVSLVRMSKIDSTLDYIYLNSPVPEFNANGNYEYKFDDFNDANYDILSITACNMYGSVTRCMTGPI